MSGLKINFHKSELFLFGQAYDKIDIYQRVFTCQLGAPSMKYLGIHVSNVRIRNKH